MSEPRRGFASDNNSGICPEVMDAIARANVGHVPGYGEDEYTYEAEAEFRKLFGEDIKVLFVFTGTAANALAIGSVCRPWENVFCASTAHINTDECGSPEHNCGVKLVSVETPDGKLRPEYMEDLLGGRGFVHSVQPKLISISQTAETGRAYTRDEIAALADFAHANGMYLHMDGARLGNCVVEQKLPVREYVKGVDVLSFGGTKNGMLGGEAVVYLNPALAEGAEYVRKQYMQLVSKMRFVSVQFTGLLRDSVWLKNVRHANNMAKLLKSKLEGIPGVGFPCGLDANELFVSLPADKAAALAEKWLFFEIAGNWRFVTSWNTTEEEVNALAEDIRSLCI